MNGSETRKCNILIIEEGEKLRSRLRYRRCKIASTSSLEETLEKINSINFNVVLFDIDTRGLDLLEGIDAIQRVNKDIVMILITRDPTNRLLAEVIKRGVYGYVTKPVNTEELEMTINRAIERQRLVISNRELQRELRQRYNFENILGISRNMQVIYETIEKIAKTDAPVLIQGESGTGKALIARAIHYNSNRATKQLIEVNCGCIPETLLESELFGYERGAFTGATRLKRGRFELADRGTLFLDEVAEMSLTSQVKLLRVLQEGEFERLGGEGTIKVDVRIIAATNKDLEEEMKKGRFREDLYYRLNVVYIFINPLRERREDIPILIDHFLEKFSEKHKKSIKGIHQRALEILLDYTWPGNVRELENAIERAVIMENGERVILEDHLPLSVRSPVWKAYDPSMENLTETFSLSHHIENLEKRLFIRALRETGGNKTKASLLLGLSLPTFRKKLKRYLPSLKNYYVMYK